MVSLHTQSEMRDWACEVIKTVAGNVPNFIKNEIEQIYTFRDINQLQTECSEIFYSRFILIKPQRLKGKGNSKTGLGKHSNILVLRPMFDSWVHANSSTSSQGAPARQAKPAFYSCSLEWLLDLLKDPSWSPYVTLQEELIF